MTNKPRKSSIRKVPTNQIPPGVVSAGLAEHARLRREQREGFAKFNPLSSAFDEVHAQLQVLSEAEELNEEVVHLLRDVQVLMIEGIDRILSVPVPHDVEEARKMLETEFLLRDFAADPGNVEVWSQTESWRRQSHFGFGELRKREEKRLGLDDETVIAPRDYWITHSLNSHPKPLKDVKRRTDHWSWSMLNSLGDLIEHAKSVVNAAQIYIVAAGIGIPSAFADLPTRAIEESWERMHGALHANISDAQLEATRQPRPKK